MQRSRSVPSVLAWRARTARPGSAVSSALRIGLIAGVITCFELPWGHMLWGASVCVPERSVMREVKFSRFLPKSAKARQKREINFAKKRLLCDRAGVNSVSAVSQF